MFSSKLLNIKFKCFHINIKLYVYNCRKFVLTTQFHKENVALFSFSVILPPSFCSTEEEEKTHLSQALPFKWCLLPIYSVLNTEFYCCFSPRMTLGDRKGVWPPELLCVFLCSCLDLLSSEHHWSPLAFWETAIISFYIIPF